VTIWIDDHLDPTLDAWLGPNFKVVAKSLREVGLHGADDDVLFAAAKKFGIVMLTKDSDFVDRVERYGAPPQVIWLRFPNMRTVKLQSLLAKTFESALQKIREGSPVVEITLAISEE
jgi:predicted nuclease of predicted toxin-antitoxin system